MIRPEEWRPVARDTFDRWVWMRFIARAPSRSYAETARVLNTAGIPRLRGSGAWSAAGVWNVMSRLENPGAQDQPRSASPS